MAEVAEVDSKLSALRALLQDPSANYTAVAVAIAAVVTFALAIILTLIAIVMPKRRAIPAGATGAASARSPRLGVTGVVLITLIIVSGLLGGAALWYQQTSTDQFCSQTCHSMRAATVSWSGSPHSSVSCIRCHEDPGLAAIPRNAAYRLFYVYREYVSPGPIVPLAVPASRCLNCHQNIADAPLIARNGSNFTHRATIQEGTSCRSCHRSQGHEPRRK